jgi:hypothetical protein
MERVDGKVAGDHGFIITCQRVGLAGGARAPYQTRRAVRAVTGPLNRKAF